MVFLNENNYLFNNGYVTLINICYIFRISLKCVCLEARAQAHKGKHKQSHARTHAHKANKQTRFP